MTIHERIFALRRAAGLSQEALAEQVGVSRQAIGKWENGTALPGLDNLRALASALGVSCDELLTGETAGGTPDGSGQTAGAPDGDISAGAPDPADSLTDSGLLALLEAYGAAQAKAARRQRVTLVSLIVVLLALICFGVFVGVQLFAVSDRVTALSLQMESTVEGIDRRVGAIRTDIEESLRESERIVADYAWQYGAESEDAVVLTVTATPKNRRDDTTAVFSVVPADGAAVTIPAEPRAGGVFTAQIEIPLTEEFEEFSVLAAFTTGGETQTQLLYNEMQFLSQRRTTMLLQATDFRATVHFPGTDDARLVLGGGCALDIQSPWVENAPFPVSAEIALIVDGEEIERQPVELISAFGMDDPSGGAAASMGVSVTYYVYFDERELPVPKEGAVLEAAVTDSAGRTVTSRQEVYRP